MHKGKTANSLVSAEAAPRVKVHDLGESSGCGVEELYTLEE